MPTPLRVLLVEDAEDDALLLVEELRAGGYAPEYLRVDTAEQMRQALKTSSWELVLADYSLPRFSGPDALRIFKESGQDVPFIVVSGTVIEQQAIDMMRDGASDFILKQQHGRLLPAIRRDLREAAFRHERRQVTAALARERAFLSSAIELLPFPVIFNTPDGDVLRANRASYEFFDHQEPTAWWNMTLLAAETRQPIPKEQWPMMRAANGEVVPPVEGIIVLPDGREVPVLAVSAPVYVEGTLVATVVSLTDITPLKEADRAKNRFLSVLSHELRTPLANILGWAREALEVPEEAPEALRIIQRNADNQRRMLENLLEVSRLLYGKLELRRTPADLWQLALEEARSAAAEARERQVTLDFVSPEQPLPVRVDSKRIREVIENILDNALHSSSSGTRITLRGRREGASAVLIIQDTGRGIPATQLPDIFTLFQLSPEVVQSGGGLGLGLPLAKAIIEQHGGSIGISSSGAGQGSTVTVTLPLEDAA